MNPARWLTLAAAASVWLGGGPAALGQENEAAARRHFDRGSKLYDQDRFLEAAREFEAGYESDPRPLFLLNIGHSYRRGQDLRKAKAAYEKLLRTDPTTTHRPIVEDLIKTIDDALTVQDLDIRIPPRSRTGTIPPGAYLKGATAPAGESQPSLLGAPETAALAPPPSSGSSWLRSPWLWGIVAGVVTAGVAGTVFALTRGPTCPANACWKEP